MVIATDLDGCLSDFNSPYANLLIKAAGGSTRSLPSSWQTDPTFPAVWDYEGHYGFLPEERKMALGEIAVSRKFWQDLPTMEEAGDVIKCLNQLATENHQVYFITHRDLGLNVKIQSEIWLQRQGMLNPTVILCAAERKADVLGDIGDNLYIDDKWQTVADCQERGVNTYLKLAPYNAKHTDGLKVALSVKDALVREGLWK